MASLIKFKRILKNNPSHYFSNQSKELAEKKSPLKLTLSGQYHADTKTR